MGILIVVLVLLGPVAAVYGAWRWTSAKRTPAWRSLVLVTLTFWIIFGNLIFIAGKHGNGTFHELALTLWEINFLSLGSATPYPFDYEDASRHWLLWWIWIMVPAVCLVTTLLLLEWLDRESGLTLLERLKAIFTK